MSPFRTADGQAISFRRAARVALALFGHGRDARCCGRAAVERELAELARKRLDIGGPGASCCEFNR